MNDQSDALKQIALYQELVVQYEALNDRIHEMLNRVGGDTRKFSPEEFQQYRQIARKRDDVFNEVRVLQQQLMEEDGHTPGEDTL